MPTRRRSARPTRAALRPLAGALAAVALSLATPLLGAPSGQPLPGWTHELGLEIDLSTATDLAGTARDTGSEGHGLMVHALVDLEDAAAQDPNLGSIAAA